MAGKKQQGARRHRMPAPERREEIVEQAMALFARKGFRGVRTKDLAEACGVSEALLYHFFASKADLYDAILERKIGELSEEAYLPAEAMERGDDEAVLTTVAAQMVQSWRQDPTFLRLILYSALEGHDLSSRFHKVWISRILDRLARYLDRRRKEGDLRPGEARRAARAFVGQVIHLLLIRELFGTGPRTEREWEKTVKHLVQLSLEGLRSRPGARGRDRK
jgi:AcrR family transcriptional regulator